ncbi:MAG: helix-turn-helix transcriptional regulator [Bryobacterales bacterium]|nr:helix-turn-helix transcriptional regulator [Bryobacterales bacterium]
MGTKGNESTKSPDPRIEQLLPLPAPFFQILIALASGEAHGYAIMQDVAERTHGKLRLSPGTLYGSIKRMLELGLIQEVRKRDPEDERRRHYRLTDFGSSVARAETARLEATLRYARSSGLAAQQS